MEERPEHYFQMLLVKPLPPVPPAPDAPFTLKDWRPHSEIADTVPRAATRLARQFRVEKMKVLLARAAATRARADGSEKAGRLLPAPSDDAEAASATGGRPSLPGLGLSRVRD